MISTEKYNNSFASTLNDIVKKTSIPCELLSKELNYEVSTIYKWINNKRKPSKKYIEHICADIGIIIKKYVACNEIITNNLFNTIKEYHIKFEID